MRRRGAAQHALEREHVARVRRGRLGRRSRRRSGPPARRAGAQRQRRQPDGRRTGRGRGAVQPHQVGPPGDSARAPCCAARACRRSRAPRTRPARRPRASAGAARSRPRGAPPRAEAVRTRRVPGTADVEAVLRDRVAARSARSQQPLGELGLAVENGCRSGAGTTSSVTRSIPWSSSQSRMSAQRGNVAGSTSWIATATASPRSRRTSRLAARGRRQCRPVAVGEPRERAIPRAVGDGGQAGAGEPLAGSAGRRPAVRPPPRAHRGPRGAAGPWRRRARASPGRPRRPRSPAVRSPGPRGRPGRTCRCGSGRGRCRRWRRRGRGRRRPASRGRSRARRGARAAPLLGAAAREHEVQPRVQRARRQERVGEQVDPLLAGRAAPRRGRCARRAAGPAPGGAGRTGRCRRRGPSARCGRRRSRGRAASRPPRGSATARGRRRRRRPPSAIAAAASTRGSPVRMPA